MCPHLGMKGELSCGRGLSPPLRPLLTHLSLTAGGCRMSPQWKHKPAPETSRYIGLRCVWRPVSGPPNRQRNAYSESPHFHHSDGCCVCLWGQEMGGPWPLVRKSLPCPELQWLPPVPWHELGISVLCPAPLSFPGKEPSCLVQRQICKAANGL